MKQRTLLGLLLGLYISSAAFAADQVAREETTPSKAEGALTADQVPPISSINKLTAAPAAAPVSAAPATPQPPSQGAAPPSMPPTAPVQ